MDNNNTTTAYSTANVEEFKMEVISLLKKIDHQIEMKASRTSDNDHDISKKMAVSLGVLKIHEFKLNEMLAWLEDMSVAQWIEHKAGLVADFEAAYRDFHPEVVR